MDETQDQTPPPAKPKIKAEPRKPYNPVRLSDLAAKRAQNLRDNLAKRKQQARARSDQKDDKNTENQ